MLFSWNKLNGKGQTSELKRGRRGKVASGHKSEGEKEGSQVNIGNQRSEGG